MNRRPTQGELLLPLLETLARHGPSRPRDASDALARKLAIAPAERQRRTHAGRAGLINAWNRTTRYVRLKARTQGLLFNTNEGLWSLTEEGHHALALARPGVIITLYQTHSGQLVWADARSAAGQVLDPNSVQLLFSSPPYPLTRPKAYGNLPPEQHITWLLDVLEETRFALKHDASLVLNVGDVWESGQPTQSTYPFELLLALTRSGYHLCQAFMWHNPARLPGPAEWVTVRRERVTHATEHVFGLARTPHPKADNRRVLRAYSDSMRARINAGGERGARRPSGHQHRAGAFARDNGGSIPHNLLQIANSSSNDAYLEACREHNETPHPARAPEALSDFFIEFLTDLGDWVLDPFAGSNTTGASAERLGRNWIGFERSLAYAHTSRHRFPQARSPHPDLSAFAAQHARQHTPQEA